MQDGPVVASPLQHEGSDEDGDLDSDERDRDRDAPGVLVSAVNATMLLVASRLSLISAPLIGAARDGLRRRLPVLAAAVPGVHWDDCRLLRLARHHHSRPRHC